MLSSIVRSTLLASIAGLGFAFVGCESSTSEVAEDRAPEATLDVSDGEITEDPISDESIGQREGESPSRGSAMNFIGSKAPALDIEHWISCPDGGQPVTDFEPGNVYVVEFWATWCGPCVMSMPHLAETQQEYADEGVRIISISDEPLDTVTAFLEKKHPTAADDQTVAEVTQPYCLTTDPDRSAYKDYMEAAEQRGIPSSFIVGKTGEIEWVGHPMEMDQPLDQIVDGTWDRAAFVEEWEYSRRLEDLQRVVGDLISKDDTDGALAKINETIAAAPNPESAVPVQQLKLSIMVQAGGYEEEVVSLIESLLEENAANYGTLNSLAWTIYILDENDKIDNDALLERAITILDDGLEDQEPNLKASALDTQAHLYHNLDQLDTAIEKQTQAVAIATQNPAAYQSYLDELKEEKSGGAEKPEADASDEAPSESENSEEKPQAEQEPADDQEGEQKQAAESNAGNDEPAVTEAAADELPKETNSEEADQPQAESEEPSE